MSMLQRIALIFTLIGALNWGLIGFFRFNLVSAIFGSATTFERIIYGIVGLAAVINIGLLFRTTREFGTEPETDRI